MRGIKLLSICGFLVFAKLILGEVKVSVYYETMCPDCAAFIKNQLHPNYKIFGDKLIKLELIPYGHAKEQIINGTKKFTCQHGPKECFGNEVHGCIINSQLLNKSENFIFCSENGTPPSTKKILKNCANQEEISWSNIQRCLYSSQAADIMSKNGQKTRELNPTFVPSIVFNDVYNEEDSIESLTNFKSVICKYLENKPDQC